MTGGKSGLGALSGKFLQPCVARGAWRTTTSIGIPERYRNTPSHQKASIHLPVCTVCNKRYGWAIGHTERGLAVRPLQGVQIRWFNTTGRAPRNSQSPSHVESPETVQASKHSETKEEGRTTHLEDPVVNRDCIGKNSRESGGMVERLASRYGMNMNTISMFATWLCVLDCTVLPVVLTALPIVGFLSPANIEIVKHVLHHVSLYFVLPVGGMALYTNHQQHKRKEVLGLGVAGLSTIVASNAPFGVEIIPHAWHAIANTTGCAMLLSSQYWSRRLVKGCCDHDHDHGRSSHPSQSLCSRSSTKSCAKPTH
eukprot:gb/GECG01004849.1/.p1 GENE.gb/GECG01004849.1/~~gb/GECG01004849.1/.p1  ORF type:complete len:311 (+),score=7.98 gb/GECG01004849.1/:1-933(+)